MNRIIIFFLIGVLFIENINSKTIKRKFGNKDEEQRREKSSDKKEGEETPDNIDDLPMNATLRCYSCGDNESRCEDKKSFEKTECDPGEICWTSYSKSGYARGCANRQCIPSVFDDNATRISISNVCCTRELCNHGSFINRNSNIMMLFSLVLCFIINLFL